MSHYRTTENLIY